MERNSILRPHCSPRKEEEASKQVNRLLLAQKSLLEFNENIIAAATPTLEETKDVGAAVSIARLQHSAGRLAAIGEKLEALACGTRIDGQQDDAIESVKEAYKIIRYLEKRLHGRKGHAPQNPQLVKEEREQPLRKYESSNTSGRKEPGEENGTWVKHTTSTKSMEVPVIGYQTQASSSLATSPGPTTTYASMNNHSAETAHGIRQTNVPPSIGTKDAMILGTPPQKRNVIQQESPQTMSTASALEQNIVNDGPDSDEVTAKAYAPRVLQSSPEVARYVVDSMKKDNHKRELANLDAGGPPTEVETTTEVETQLLLKDKRADPSYMCGCDGSAYSAGPTAMTRKVHQLHPHEGTATKGKLLERSPCKTTDPSTIVHLPVGLRDDAKDRSPTSSGKRLDKKAAVGMGTPMIKKANRCVRKSEKPRECRTGNEHTEKGINVPGFNWAIGYKGHTPVKQLQLKSLRTLSYAKRRACVIMEKPRPKVRRKAKSRRKRRPKIRKKV